MPTLSKPQLTEPESPWGVTFDRIYRELCKDRVGILTALGFYAEHDLSPPESSDAIPTKDEEELLRQIASALTVAAAACEFMPPGVLLATFQRVTKKPGLFFARQLPQPVERAIALDYQRHDEPPGTHWRDVWGDLAATFPGEVEQPIESAIAKAATAAIARIQNTRKAGRPYNQADQILAIELGTIFGQSGKLIRRRHEPIMREGKVVYTEAGGPIYDFLDLVLKPLRPYLWEKVRVKITTATIVRHMTQDFP